MGQEFNKRWNTKDGVDMKAGDGAFKTPKQRKSSECLPSTYPFFLHFHHSSTPKTHHPNNFPLVFKQPLALHSTSPMTGFMRTGYCEVPNSDFGKHGIAGILTNEFLDFSAARGNDLRQAGLKDGCKWCLCVSRWKEAFDARTGDSDKKVPKIVLKATNERALEGVTMEDLRRCAVDKE